MIMKLSGWGNHPVIESKVINPKSLDEINEDLRLFAKSNEIGIDCLQSNSEGDIVSMIQEAPENYDGLVINPAAYTHYSIAIRDALASIEIPKIEVHLSNIYQREPFRQTSVTAAVCHGVISGFATNSYFLAIQQLIILLK